MHLMYNYMYNYIYLIYYIAISYYTRNGIKCKLYLSVEVVVVDWNGT